MLAAYFVVGSGDLVWIPLVSDKRGDMPTLIKEALAEVGRDGVDIYFDNVGGAMLGCHWQHA